MKREIGCDHLTKGFIPVCRNGVQEMRALLVMALMLFGVVTSAEAQVSVGIGLPGVSIGINLPVYPQLVRVPGYPVYYAPQMNSNYFFYDGLYWVYQGDNWYASSWYNGPWGLVSPEVVPLYVLRVPVRYFRHPPAYFHGWRGDAPPRWDEHWGNAWTQGHSGWNNWNRNAVPAPAPLPAYQRQYSGDRYPHAEQQQVLQSRNYRYQPQEAVVQQHYQAQRIQSSPAPAPQAKRAAPPPQRVEPQQGKVQHEQKASKPQGIDSGQRGEGKGQHGNGRAQEPKQSGQGKGQGKGEQQG
jgi:hypothetical protein